VRGWCANTRTGCGYFTLLGFVFTSTAFAQTIDEYQVKAAFLYNFAKFVEWPAQTFKTDKDPVRICVLGQDPFGSFLGDAVGGKTVLGRPFVLSDISSADQVTDCQILFISSSERKRLRAIFAEFRTAGVLTVGETDGFATQGGIVNFKLTNGRVCLEINIEAAVQAKLRINSSVLSLAQIVKTGPQK
jgi:hypothetical protein